MYRTSTLLTCLVSLSFTARWARAQLQNPAGFLDPAGANRAGTAAPPNTTIGPIGGSTLPPGAPSGGYYSREVENNPALRQEVRRPFGGGGYRFRGAPPPDGVIPEGAGDPDKISQASGGPTSQSRRMLTPEWTPPERLLVNSPAIGRYVYSQGRHWYWMPNNTWDVWSNAGWVPYKRGMFSQPTFGYGTQVRGYRAIPADGEAGAPAGRPGEAAAPAEEGSTVARANRPTGNETTYAPQETAEPAPSGGEIASPASGNSRQQARPCRTSDFISPCIDSSLCWVTATLAERCAKTLAPASFSFRRPCEC